MWFSAQSSEVCAPSADLQGRTWPGGVRWSPTAQWVLLFSLPRSLTVAPRRRDPGHLSARARCGWRWACGSHGHGQDHSTGPPWVPRPPAAPVEAPSPGSGAPGQPGPLSRMCHANLRAVGCLCGCRRRHQQGHQLPSLPAAPSGSDLSRPNKRPAGSQGRLTGVLSVQSCCASLSPSLFWALVPSGLTVLLSVFPEHLVLITRSLRGVPGRAQWGGGASADARVYLPWSPACPRNRPVPPLHTEASGFLEAQAWLPWGSAFC